MFSHTDQRVLTCDTGRSGAFVRPHLGALGKEGRVSYMRTRAKQEDAVNRSFRQRVGALAGVLLAGTVVLAWASPASANHLVGSTATLGAGPGAITVTCGPGSDGEQATGSDTVAGGGTVTGLAQCGANTDVSSAAQVIGTYNGIPFKVQCSYAKENGVTVVTYQETVNNQVVFQSATQGAGSLEIGGVTVASVNCFAPHGPAPYPLAVGASGASEAVGPALVTQPATADDSSRRGTTWLLLAGAAALLLVGGQLAIGRRFGRRGSQATD